MRSTMVSRNASSMDAVVRRTQADSADVRLLSANSPELVGVPTNSSEFARPVVRLDPDEPIEGDTDRIELVDSPKAAELSRRRRVARERGHSGPRAVSSSSTGMPRPRAETPIDPIELEMRADAVALDRMMWVVLVGAGLLAVVAGLSLSAG